MSSIASSRVSLSTDKDEDKDEATASAEDIVVSPSLSTGFSEDNSFASFFASLLVLFLASSIASSTKLSLARNHAGVETDCDGGWESIAAVLLAEEFAVGVSFSAAVAPASAPSRETAEASAEDAAAGRFALAPVLAEAAGPGEEEEEEGASPIVR